MTKKQKYIIEINKQAVAMAYGSVDAAEWARAWAKLLGRCVQVIPCTENEAHLFGVSRANGQMRYRR